MGLADTPSTIPEGAGACPERGLDMAKRPDGTRGVGMIGLRAIGCAAVTLALSQGSVLAIDMKITGIKINSADYVDPTELYIPPGAVFNVKCQDVRSGGLGFRWFKMRVDGIEVACPANQCQFNVPVKSAGVNLHANDFEDCLHVLQCEGFTEAYPSEAGETDNSDSPAVWLSPYADCTGPEECDATEIGGPVDIATGTMHYEVMDLRIPGPLGIEVRRRYRSDQSDLDAGVGHGWRHPYMVKLEDVDAGRKAFVDERGRRVYFGATQSNGGVPIWNPNAIERLELVEETSPPGWSITDEARKVHRFDTSGRLTGIEDRNGNSVSLGYTGSKLTAITDAFGRGMTLAYDGNDRLSTLTAGSRSVTYTYDSTTGNLERADWSDGSFETYEYEDPNDVHNLTAVRDSYGHLIESHTYDTSDRVTATQSDSGNSAYTLVYNSATQTTVTNSLGVPSVFIHDSFSGMVTTSSGPGCASCGGGGTEMTIVRDRFLRPVTITDAEGVVTKLSYDAAGNVLTRTEAFGVPGVARTTTYTWHPTFNLPLTISVPSVGSCGSPNRIVTNTYDPATGDKLTEQVTGCAGLVPFSRTTAWTYDGHGQVLTIEGPRTDVSDVTTYDYYPDGDSDVSRRGRLQRVTNALGHETAYAGYDLFGNVGSVTTASNVVGNSVETTYLHDGKDRVTETRTKGPVPADDIVTEQVYDLEGNLDFVRLPNCVEAGLACAFSVDYVYDTVNRLTETHDPFGNKTVYTYDTAGNRTREEYRDGLDVVQRFTNFKYDSYNRLQYTYFTDVVPENAGSVFFKYSYFDDGQRQSERDPEGHITSFTYDELKRLKTVTQTVAVDALITEYGYDVQDNLATVEDPNGLVTTYTNHDMGWRLGVNSPDTGTTTHTFDGAGNLTSTTDANGVTSSRMYDALDRLTSITYVADASVNVSQSYDSAAVTFGIGRRTGMTDASGSTVYGYDRRGLPTREEKTIGAATYVTQYGYDKTGNLKQILYPTDNPGLRQGQADYTYDSADRVTAITAKVNGSTTPVASSVAYKPFGPRTSLTFGNGLVDSRTYGTRYQLGAWTLGSLLSYSHAFDNDLNLASRTDNLNAANSRVFGYDEIHRLTEAAGPWGPGTSCPGGATYTYDLNGNRLCKGEVTPATNYTYLSGTNRLGSTTGGEPATFSYDANGNTTGDGAHTYDYSDADRLASVDTGPTATYKHDGDGRRVVKTVGSQTTHFFYDPAGRLLSEIVPASAIGKDYLFLHDAPVGRVDWTTEQELGNVLRLGKSSPLCQRARDSDPLGV